MARKKKKLINITAQDWIQLSSSPAIQNNIKTDLYSEAYLSLAKLFPDIQKTGWDGAVAALHTVYGWMPRIPRLRTFQSWSSKERDRLVKILIKAEHGKHISMDELFHLKVFSDNSIVGSSKILHFLCPTQFPIWDRRVARAFYNSKKINPLDVNNADRYLNYQQTILDWISNPSVASQIISLRNMASAFLSKNVSDLRVVELVLFHKP